MSTIGVVTASVVVVAVLFAMLSVIVAHLFTTPKRVQPLAPPAHIAPTYERVAFTARSDVLRLAAWYRRTDDARGAVILVHGRDGCRGDELRGTTIDLVTAIASHGLSVLLIDLRGHGESAAGRLTFGLRESRDVLGAVDFLLQRGYAPARIGVLGASMGGASAIAAAAEEPAIGALVTDSAFASLEEVLRAQFSRLTHLPSFFLRGALVAARLLTGEHLLSRPPAVNMRRLQHRPTLVIHAAHDPFVPVHHAHALRRASSGAIWITPGDRHLASFGVAGREYIDVVADFFGRHIAHAAARPAVSAPAVLDGRIAQLVQHPPLVAAAALG